jgi:murein tripeptide amidase MpaA
MPPTGYLTSVGVESCLQYLAATYPGICQLITLPETSIEGRTMRAVKLGSGGGAHRHGLLLLGGAHARELVPPDALVSLAFRLCQAYSAGTSLTFGGRTYAAGTIKLLIESLDTFILPLVNPDGRTFVQAPTGDAWWRKNRRPNPGGCVGVDLNRNYDFLWSSGIGTSASSCDYQIFKGTAPFSEPETRNVRWMLDAYPNIECLVDVHSYSELFLYPWGDDDNQTTDPSMNFMNPAYNGLRGTPGDSMYREYIPAADLNWYVTSGGQVRTAIAAVRGHTYLLEQSVGLYPTSGTSDDYAYSRHFVDPSKARVYAYTLEIGREFQPVYGEALQEIDETSSGLIQFAIQCLCAVETTALRSKRMVDVAHLRTWRARLEASVAGQRYLALEPVVSSALLARIGDDEALRHEAVGLLEGIVEAVAADPEAPRMKADLVDRAERLLERLGAVDDPEVRSAVKVLQGETRHFRDRTIPEGLKLASRGQEVPPTVAPPTSRRSHRPTDPDR